MDSISFLTVPIIVFGIIGVVFVWLLLSYIPLRLWIAAWAAGVRIGLKVGKSRSLDLAAYSERRPRPRPPESG